MMVAKTEPTMLVALTTFMVPSGEVVARGMRVRADSDVVKYAELYLVDADLDDLEIEAIRRERGVR